MNKPTYTNETKMDETDWTGMPNNILESKQEVVIQNKK